MSLSWIFPHQGGGGEVPNGFRLSAQKSIDFQGPTPSHLPS